MVLKFLKSSYDKAKQALSKTSLLLGQKLRFLFSAQLDSHALEELEKVLYEADLGVQTATELTKKIKQLHAADPSLQGEALVSEIRKEIVHILTLPPSHSPNTISSPYLILIVGVNGNGKTTSLAKLAKKYQQEGKKVLIAAADTFRAAAVEQLEIWADRLGVDIVKGAAKSDPAAVAFDAATAGKARGADIILIDTAGRLHNKTHLMQELDKIKRACKKIIPEAPHEILMVLDTTTGQNAIDQARAFHQYTPLTGLILTKLDGSAKGGIVVSIQRELGIPVKYIGLGEGIDDLEPFDAQSYVDALFK